MDAVEIDARSEEIAVARQCQGRQVAAPAPAPDADAGRVDVRACGEPPPGGEDVAIFRSAFAPRLGRIAEGLAVAGAAALVHRQHTVALRGEMLVHDIGF